jgi:nucleoside-diphosphate-sugar epimerase
MKLLITGNLGYVGPVVVEHLRQRFPDAELVGYDAGYFSSGLTGVDHLPEVSLDSQIFCDVRDFDPKHLAGVDAVVQLAAISNDPISNLYEGTTFDINAGAVIDIARKAREAGVRDMIFASSCSMYGLADSGPRSEGADLNPLTPYSRSKVQAEQDLAELASDSFRVTALRYSTACGMSPRLRLDLVLNDFVACAVSGQTITVLSDGTPWRPLIHVKDMARAVEWALVRGANGVTQAHLPINVGGDEWNYQVKDLAARVAASVEGGAMSINPDAQPDKRSYRVDFARYRELAPDHQPQVDLDAAIAELEAGLRSMSFADEDFRNSPLMRIHHLGRLRESGRLDEELRWTHRRGSVASLA